jgi:hypothetical protein
MDERVKLKNVHQICWNHELLSWAVLFLALFALVTPPLFTTQARILSNAPTVTSTPQHLKWLPMVQDLFSQEVCQLPCILGLKPTDSIIAIQKRLRENFGQDIVGDTNITVPQIYYFSLSLIRADDSTVALEIHSNGTNVEFIAAQLSDIQ